MKILFVILFALLPTQVGGIAGANYWQVQYFLIQPTFRLNPPKGDKRR